MFVRTPVLCMLQEGCMRRTECVPACAFMIHPFLRGSDFKMRLGRKEEDLAPAYLVLAPTSAPSIDFLLGPRAFKRSNKAVGTGRWVTSFFPFRSKNFSL